MPGRSVPGPHEVLESSPEGDLRITTRKRNVWLGRVRETSERRNAGKTGASRGPSSDSTTLSSYHGEIAPNHGLSLRALRPCHRDDPVRFSVESHRGGPHPCPAAATPSCSRLLPLLSSLDCCLRSRRRPRSRRPRPRSRPSRPSAPYRSDRADQGGGAEASQVMATLSYLTDVIGPRLTGSPGLKRANEWTCQTLNKWGLANAHLEAWGPFGRGWTLKRFSAQVVEPQCIPLIAFPKAWSPSTDGALTAPVVYFDAKSEAEFAKFKGKIKGAIVLTGPPREVSARFEPLASRKTDKELLELADAAEPTPFRFDQGAASPATGARAGRPGRPAGRWRRADARPRAGRRRHPRQRPPRRRRAGRHSRRAADAVRPRDAGPDGAGPQEGQVPRRRGSRAAGRLQLPGRGRHAVRLRRQRPRRPAVSHARTGAGRAGASRPGTRTPPRSRPRSSWPRSTTTGWSG